MPCCTRRPYAAASSNVPSFRMASRSARTRSALKMSLARRSMARCAFRRDSSVPPTTHTRTTGLPSKPALSSGSPPGTIASGHGGTGGFGALAAGFGGGDDGDLSAARRERDEQGEDAELRHRSSMYARLRRSTRSSSRCFSMRAWNETRRRALSSDRSCRRRAPSATSARGSGGGSPPGSRAASSRPSRPRPRDACA